MGFPSLGDSHPSPAARLGANPLVGLIGGAHARPPTALQSVTDGGFGWAPSSLPPLPRFRHLVVVPGALRDHGSSRLEKKSTGVATSRVPREASRSAASGSAVRRFGDRATWSCLTGRSSCARPLRRFEPSGTSDGTPSPGPVLLSWGWPGLQRICLNDASDRIGFFAPSLVLARGPTSEVFASSSVRETMKQPGHPLVAFGSPPESDRASAANGGRAIAGCLPCGSLPFGVFPEQGSYSPRR
jgi:hypothetical protein